MSPELNQTLADFALHYQTTILPARVRKPKDKSSGPDTSCHRSTVEGAVDIVYGRVYAPLRNRVFHCLSELNAAISELTGKHNQTRFQGRSTPAGSCLRSGKGLL